MYRQLVLLSFLCAALLTAACDDPPPDAPSEPPPTEITETVTGNVTVNGAVTHSFSVTRAGRVTARLGSLSVADAVVGLSLGTFNGQTCTLIVTKDDATVAGTATFPVTGDASTTGAFCVRIYDVGRLTSSVDYEIVLTHF